MSKSPTSSVEALREALAYVDSWLEYRLWKLEVPGAQAAVWFDGKIQFSKAYGVSDLETGEAMTTSHLFRIASHSKTFTGTAVMQLVEAGKLRLDDTVGAWIPELKGSELSEVTVRELVSNTGGVIRDGTDGTYWEHNRQFPDEAELIAMSLREGAVRQPEATYKYSNIGFSLLGMIIGKADGSSYNDYVKRAIVGKLGLRNTGPELEPARLSEYAGAHTGLHSRRARQVIPHVDTRAMASATGFYSTAEDLMTYASAHFFGDDRLLSDRSKNEMQRPVWTGLNPDAPRDGYGYGIGVQHYGGHRTVGHGGGYPGHITRTIWDPEEGLAISVLTNAVDGPAEELAAGVLKILDKARETSPRLTLNSGRTNTTKISAPDEPGHEISLESFTGRFAGLWSVTDVAVLGGKLIATSPMPASPLLQPYELAVVDENTLKIMDGSVYASVGEHFRYQRDSKGKIISVLTAGYRSWPIEDYRARDNAI